MKEEKSSTDDLGEVFVISVAAELAGMHAQTLRTYDRMGLVTPERTSGGGRRYSRKDISRLRRIQQLSQEEGVNLAGIRAIIGLTEEVDRLRAEIEELREQQSRPRGELVHVPRSTAIVMWEPRRGRVRRYH